MLCVSASVFAQTKPAYLIIERTVTNQAEYDKLNLGKQFDGKAEQIVSRNSEIFVVRGVKLASISIYKFPSMAKAKEFVGTESYKKNVAEGLKVSKSSAYIVEGK